MSECRLCLGEHDSAIHGATERVHQWLRSRLTRVTEASPQIEPWPNRPPLGSVKQLLGPATRRKRARCPK